MKEKNIRGRRPGACGPRPVSPGAKLIETDHSGAATRQINEHRKRPRRRRRGREKGRGRAGGYERERNVGAEEGMFAGSLMERCAAHDCLMNRRGTDETTAEREKTERGKSRDAK